MAFSYSWDETVPAGTRDINLGDNDIRDFKAAIRERLAIDHNLKATEGADTTIGQHKKVTFTVQGTAPTAVADAVILYTYDVSAKAELYFKDEDGDSMQLTSDGSFVGGMKKEVKMWWGTLATIPTGWQICDGTNGLPDLRSKFVRCTAAATDPAALTGDATMVAAHSHTGATLTATQSTHGHTFRAYSGASGSDGAYFWRDGSSCNASYDVAASSSVVAASAGAITMGGSTAESGTASLYALAFIGKPQ